MINPDRLGGYKPVPRLFQPGQQRIQSFYGPWQLMHQNIASWSKLLRDIRDYLVRFVVFVCHFPIPGSVRPCHIKQVLLLGLGSHVCASGRKKAYVFGFIVYRADFSCTEEGSG